MADEKKCCCASSCKGILIFLVGLIIGGVIMGAFAMFGKLDFLSDAVIQSKPTTGSQPGVLVQQNSDGSWYKSSEPTVTGTWVKVATDSSVKLLKGQAFQTADGQSVELQADGWFQTSDVSWVQFSDTSTVLKQGAWVKLPSDMELNGKSGVVKLTKGTLIQLLSNATVELQEQSSDAEIFPL